MGACWTGDNKVCFFAVQLEFIDYHPFLNFIHALLQFSNGTCCFLCVEAYQMYSWVSSAYIWYLSQYFRMILPSSTAAWIVNVFKMDPKTDPCGTPQVKPVGLEVALPILTVWVLRLKYEANHVSDTPKRPTFSERRVSNMLWSTVSKAALKSSSTKYDARWLSAAVSRSLWILSNVISVLWPFL